MDKQLLIELIMGVVLVPLVQYLKGVLKWGGNAALALMLALSILSSVVIEALSGGLTFTNGEEILRSVSTVVATSMILYRALSETKAGDKVLNDIKKLA